jgi:hypothetical protein
MDGELMEYLKLYPWEDYKDQLYDKWYVDGTSVPKNPDPMLRYYSPVGNPKDKVYVVFFRTQDDMIAFDNWDVDGLKYQHMIDHGRNLYNRIMKQLED